MRRARGWSTGLWAFLLVVAFAAASLAVGRRETMARPDPGSYGPSGLRALAELLESQGYRVSEDRRTRPVLQPGDAAVALFPSDIAFGAREEGSRKVQEALRSHVQRGGSALVSYYRPSFQEDTLKATTVRTRDVFTQAELKVTSGGGQISLSEGPGFPLFAGQWSAIVVPLGQGRYVDLSSPLLLTNRFLDRDDAALVATRLAAAIARPKGRVVFLTGTFDPQDPGFFGSLGDWAVGAWYQLLFLAGVVIYTLGRRLGLPDMERRRQRSSRELLDAVGDTLLRGKQARLALEKSLEHADLAVRSRLKVSKGTPRERFWDELPESLRQSWAEAEALRQERKVPGRMALAAVRRLDAELASFLHGSGIPER